MTVPSRRRRGRRRVSGYSESAGASGDDTRLPEPDLASPERARNAGRVVEVARELARVADVAAGKVILPEMTNDPKWLQRLAARTHGEQPPGPIVRWLELFADELDTVWRAANTVQWQQWMSDGNLAAAASMAERLLKLAQDASLAERGWEGATGRPDS